MVHQFFNAAAACPAIVDEFLSKTKQSYGKTPLKFTGVFSIFFPQKGYHVNEDNLSSWLDAISNNFLFHDYHEIVHKYTLIQVTNLFLKLEMYPLEEANKRIFQFWLYLTKIYWKLVGMNYDGKDNIFGFMTGFPIYKTKAVIIGNRPPKDKSSTGYAFHGTICESTKQLLHLVKSEGAAMARPTGDNLFGFDAYDRYWQEVMKKCGLTGWIQQGVLLMNAHLTHHGGDSISFMWQIFTDFIVQYLNSQMSNLVFFLLGERAILKDQHIDKQRHFVLPLCHPACYCFNSIPKKDWIEGQPFHKANAYLSKNGVVPIEWCKVR
ncbi:unnamed protein product [Orchesella dallaii]|uniref:Uracil-DNA glycosylase-like domain-containing protein n=1 Tax=Orchesella dallaii TaxID=48710 RepID=A0ABP1QAC3_9HEXA